MANYTGSEPFPGVSPEQKSKIEEACAAADPTWRDGIWREVNAILSKDLEEDPTRTFSDSQVESAINEALTALGIDPETKAAQRQAAAEGEKSEQVDAPETDAPEADAAEDAEEDSDDTPDDDGDATPRRRRAKRK